MGNYTMSGLAQMANENEVATVLSHFNSQYIYDVIEEKLEGRFNVAMSMQNANVVQAFNQNFKDLRSTYPSDIANINNIESETYKEIIQLICRWYGIEYFLPMPAEGQMVDYFTVAFYLYDFLVSNFFNYICKFYAGYIYVNKDQLYDSMGLEQFRKNKDSSTQYGKSVFKDIKTAVISANIMMVIQNMKSFDIPYDMILSSIYGNANVVGMLSSIINFFPGDFFNHIYEVPLHIKSILCTNIRLELQRLSAADNGVGYKLN